VRTQNQKGVGVGDIAPLNFKDQRFNPASLDLGVNNRKI
jgi:hypothetical protein